MFFDDKIKRKINHEVDNHHFLTRFSKTSAGSLTSWLFIFLFHFFMLLVFLITSNFPDLISL